MHSMTRARTLLIGITAVLPIALVAAILVSGARPQTLSSQTFNTGECAIFGSYCPTGQYCRVDCNRDGPERGRYCTFTCVPRLATGSSCTQGGECIGGVCVTGGFNGKRCARYAGDNQYTTTPYPERPSDCSIIGCPTSLQYCHYSCKETGNVYDRYRDCAGVCEPRLATGSPCTQGGECIGGYCKSKICARYAGDNQYTTTPYPNEAQPTQPDTASAARATLETAQQSYDAATEARDTAKETADEAKGAYDEAKSAKDETKQTYLGAKATYKAADAEDKADAMAEMNAAKADYSEATTAAAATKKEYADAKTAYAGAKRTVKTEATSLKAAQNAAKAATR